MDARIATTTVPTRLGPLSVRRRGSGPPVVLWHSLFVDSTTFDALAEDMARQRELILIDGPGHGLSPGIRRLFTLDDCAEAAAGVLDALGVAGAVDWVGNAWGGHVGVVFAQAHPDRCRTLTTIGSPMYPLPPRERRLNTALVALYRLLGPAPFTKPIVDALVGPDARTSEPASAQAVAAAFRAGTREGKYWTMRSVMLHRPDLRSLLPQIPAPTLMLLAADDPRNDEREARAAAASMPHGSCSLVPGAGHVGPVLRASSELKGLIGTWWAQAPEAAA